LRFGLAAEEDIVVVDNASPDASFEQLTKAYQAAKVVRSDKNGGFGYGVNLAARYCKREFLLILNPDTYFQSNSLHAAIGVFDASPQVAVAGLDLVLPSGQRQYSGRRFYSLLDILGRRTPIGQMWPVKSRIDRHLMISSWDSGEAFSADWVAGTGFLIRRTVFEEIGGMDESYFLYMEDVDLCARVWQAEYQVVCVPGAKLTHAHQRASIAGPFSRAGRTHLQSLMNFHKKFKLPLFRPPGVNGIARRSPEPDISGSLPRLITKSSSYRPVVSADRLHQDSCESPAGSAGMVGKAQHLLH
jgi:N-acetylglucosaminyl-diphospho-decaprenol L-rhamnosyltransferase